MTEATAISIHVSGPLRDFCGGASRLRMRAASVRAVLAELAAGHAPLHAGVCDETGAVRRHVNLFVNESHIRDLDGLDTVLVPGDVVTILPAVSGG